MDRLSAIYWAFRAASETSNTHVRAQYRQSSGEPPVGTYSMMAEEWLDAVPSYERGYIGNIIHDCEATLRNNPNKQVSLHVTSLDYWTKIFDNVLYRKPKHTVIWNSPPVGSLNRLSEYSISLFHATMCFGSPWGCYLRTDFHPQCKWANMCILTCLRFNSLIHRNTKFNKERLNLN